jgi:hypothetical protein
LARPYFYLAPINFTPFVKSSLFRGWREGKVLSQTPDPPAFIFRKDALEHDYTRDKSDHDSKPFGRKQSLGEIENFPKSPATCPECKSAEGFWLIAKHEATFFQCKHCAAILEASKVFANPKEQKPFKLVIKLHR